MRKTAILLITIIFLPFLAEAQTRNDTIDPENLNYSLLDSLIKEGVDSLRIKRNRQALTNDTTLQKAAQDHADYLIEKTVLSHFQNNRKKRTVQLRVESYGGTNFLCGENLAMTYVLTPMKVKSTYYINRTYQHVANDFVTMWKKSRSHYTNLLRREYTHTGLAISFDPVSKKIIAVQVFAYKD